MMEKLSIDIERTYNGRFLVTEITKKGMLDGFSGKQNKVHTFTTSNELCAWILKKVQE